MKVAISAGGRFHAFRLAYELYRRNSLSCFYTFSYGKQDSILFPKSVVKSIGLCKFLNFVSTRLRLSRVINSSVLNVIQDNLFDYSVSKKIKKLGEIDIFVGWAHYALKSMPAIRKTGAKVIIESGSCHILEQQKMLQEEYAKWGLKYQPIHKSNCAKMVAEYQAADYIMTLSEFSRQSFIRQGLSPDKILKVPCGMDVEYFSIGRQKPAPWGAGLSSGQVGQDVLRGQAKFRVVFVGMLNVRKGVQYLLEAWNKLNLPENSTELLFVGNLQKDIKDILRTIKIKNNVVFAGATNRRDLRTILHDSSVFVLPSIEDGFGMVVGEAMASGLPVICSDHAGATDMITEGQEGFVVPAASPDKLAEKILWCYENYEQSCAMGARGSETVQNFSWDVYGEHVYKTYEKILNKKISKTI
ncbi:MAG: glycosyltransferase family 4 protein [bacterium]